MREVQERISGAANPYTSTERDAACAPPLAQASLYYTLLLDHPIIPSVLYDSGVGKEESIFFGPWGYLNGQHTRCSSYLEDCWPRAGGRALGGERHRCTMK